MYDVSDNLESSFLPRQCVAEQIGLQFQTRQPSSFVEEHMPQPKSGLVFRRVPPRDDVRQRRQDLRAQIRVPSLASPRNAFTARTKLPPSLEAQLRISHLPHMTECICKCLLTGDARTPQRNQVPNDGGHRITSLCTCLRCIHKTRSPSVPTNSARDFETKV